MITTKTSYLLRWFSQNYNIKSLFFAAVALIRMPTFPFKTGTKDLRTAFDLLDRNRDGCITASELQFMLKNLGIKIKDDIIYHLIREASHSGQKLRGVAANF
ncbi:hypothetical protein GQX74_014826 [Glossina fuscipes]|nr:hypothetical protein GQX74_014826 [Glossina fuscipes]